MKLLSIFLILAIFTSCNEEKKNKDPGTVDNELIGPPDGSTTVISEEEKQRLIENSFTIIVDSNQTVANGDSKNYIKVMIVPLQDFTVEIENQNSAIDTLGNILIDPPNMLPGTYFAPGEHTGSLNLIVNNGEVSKKITISINGPLHFINNATVAEDSENNAISLETTGGSGDVNFMFPPGDQFGRIEGDKYYPPNEDEFITFMNDLNIDADEYQYFYNMGIIAVDSNGNSTLGTISLFPKMRYELRQNNSRLQQESVPELVCTQQRENIHLKNRVYLKIIGGKPPFEILNNDAGFEISNNLYDFYIQPPEQCDSQSSQLLVLRDSMGNSREININLLPNLQLEQNIAERDNTETSRIRSINDTQIEATTEKEDTEEFILTITGGKPPYLLYKGLDRIAMQDQGNNQYLVTGDLTSQVNELELKDQLENSIHIILNQTVGTTTTISAAPLDANDPFKFFTVHPTSSIIESVIYEDYDSNYFSWTRYLNAFSGAYYRSYGNDYNSYNDKNFFVNKRNFSFSENDWYNQGYINIDINITDNVGTKYNISQKSYLPYSHKYKRYNSNSFEETRVMSFGRTFNENYRGFSTDAGFGFGNQFLDYLKNNVQIFNKEKLPSIFLGEERYDEVKLLGGFNSHKANSNLSYTNYLNNTNNNNLNTSNTTYNRYDSKSCSELKGSFYDGDFGLYGEHIALRGTDSFTFNNNYNSFFRILYTNIFRNYNQYNSFLRAKLLNDDGTIDLFNRGMKLFSIKRDIKPSSNSLPINSLFRNHSDRYGWYNRFVSHATEQDVYLGGAFEVRKRPISLYSGAQNVQYVHDDAVMFEIPNQSLVCYTTIEDYQEHYRTVESIDDSVHTKRDIRSERQPDDELQYYDEYNALCTNGRELNQRSFLNNENILKTIKNLTGSGGTPNIVVSNQLSSFNNTDLYISDKYHFYNKVYPHYIFGTNIEHNFQDGIDCSEDEQNVNIGIHNANSLLGGVYIPRNSRLFNYYPDELLIKKLSHKASSVEPLKSSFFIPTFKKNSNCTRGDRVILKIPHEPGPVEEINVTNILSELNVNQSLDFTDIYYDHYFIYLTGLTPQVAGPDTTVNVPFLLGISINDDEGLQNNYFHIYDRRNDSCTSPLTITEPYFHTNSSELGIMFNINGQYLKGGSIYSSRNTYTNDIGRIQFDKYNGELLFFRRFENFNSIENFSTEKTFGFGNHYLSKHLIKNDNSEFFEIIYFDDMFAWRNGMDRNSF